jgi:hypothetical protein
VSGLLLPSSALGGSLQIPGTWAPVDCGQLHRSAIATRNLVTMKPVRSTVGIHNYAIL